MIVKTGIDIIEVSRIEDSISKFGNSFLNRVFTEKEIEYCESKKVQKFQSYAGRFAAKEAIFKAISEICVIQVAYFLLTYFINCGKLIATE